MDIRQTAIAIDIGGTKIMGAEVDTDGHVLSSLKSPTPSGKADDVMAVVYSVIDRLISARADDTEDVGIGIAVAGTIDWRQGVVIQSPNLPFSNLRIRSMVESKYGLPVFVDNDGNLAALGEKQFGAARDAKHIIGLTIGTGIGAGIIIDGCLYRGTTGSAAEIGHMVIDANGPRCTCRSYGCFEEMASGRALLRVIREKVMEYREGYLIKLAEGKIEDITGPMITEAAQKGDEAALAAFNEVGYWLGIGINNILNIFNPELVVVGGGMADAGELILQPARRVVADRTLHPNKDVAEIVLSELGNQAGVLGAAALVFSELLT
ncbi:MAG: ROK family protein [Actinomycetota bacterium]